MSFYTFNGIFNPVGKFLTRREFCDLNPKKVIKFRRAIRVDEIVYEGRYDDTHFYIKHREGFLGGERVEEGYIVTKWLDS